MHMSFTNTYGYLYRHAQVNMYMHGGALSVTVIVVGNGIDQASSKPWMRLFSFQFPREKHRSLFSSPAMGK